MEKRQRLITMALWGVLLTAMVGVVLGKLLLPPLKPDAGQQLSQPPRTGLLEAPYPASDFALIDQNNKPFTSADLRGRPYLAAFVFTTCGEICPKMTRTMADLLPRLPPQIHMISVTVNPEHDSPDVLKDYAKTYKADESRWHFLTGDKDRIFDLANNGMKVSVRPAAATSPILHSEKLILVDGAGNIRGYYNTTDPEAMGRLINDAATVAKEAKPGRAGGAS